MTAIRSKVAQTCMTFPRAQKHTPATLSTQAAVWNWKGTPYPPCGVEGSQSEEQKRGNLISSSFT